jgi:hypothetical protein
MEQVLDRVVADVRALSHVAPVHLDPLGGWQEAIELAPEEASSCSRGTSRLRHLANLRRLGRWDRLDLPRLGDGDAPLGSRDLDLLFLFLLLAALLVVELVGQLLPVLLVFHGVAHRSSFPSQGVSMSESFPKRSSRLG